MTSKAQSIKGKIDKLDFIAMKNAGSVKDRVMRMKRQSRDQEKIFVNHISNKELRSRIYKELK
jgi:hypothetical protein